MAENKRVKLFFKNEDYWTIWIGTFLLLIGLLIFYLIPYGEINKSLEDLESKIEIEENIPFKTMGYLEANHELKKLSSANTSIGSYVVDMLRTPQKWEGNPSKAFYQSDLVKNSSKPVNTELEHFESEALIKFQQAENLSFHDSLANSQAELAANKWFKAKLVYSEIIHKEGPKSYNLFISIIILFLFLGLIFGIAAYFMGYDFFKFIKAFGAVFLLAVFAHLLGEHANMASIGFGYAIWAIILGLLISNTIGTYGWIKPAVQTEFYIKTGLILLGSEILLGKILAIGLPGIFVAWIVTPIVLVSTFWFGQKILKITSKSLNITISADLSVCGVSAAIAAAAASKATKEELTMAVGLSMIFTSTMMILLPTFINLMGMPEVLGGAWIGGTIDSTGAVVAAGAFLGETALQVAATIKMIQNMMIGFIAFFVAYYFTVRVEKKTGVKLGWGELWNRFPKFMLGFVGASIFFSALHNLSGPELGDILIEKGVIRGYTKNLRDWLFCLAFVSIGLSINFKELRHQFSGGKPLILYIVGQVFNLLLTLFMSYIMFYLIFPEITNKL